MASADEEAGGHEATRGHDVAQLALYQNEAMDPPYQDLQEKMAELMQSNGVLKARVRHLEILNETRHISLPPELRHAPTDVALGRLRKFNPMEAATRQIKGQQQTIDAQEQIIAELRQSTLELRQSSLELRQSAFDLRQAESYRDARVAKLEAEGQEKDEKIQGLEEEIDSLTESVNDAMGMANNHEASLTAMGYPSRGCW